MPAVLFHTPHHPAYREADEAEPLECSLRDALVEQFHDHPGLLIMILCRGHEDGWELQSVDPDEENARFLAASVIHRIAGAVRA